MNTAPAEPSARGVHLFGAGPFIFPARPLSKSAPGTLPVLVPAADSGPSPRGASACPQTARPRPDVAPCGAPSEALGS